MPPAVETMDVDSPVAENEIESKKEKDADTVSTEGKYFRTSLYSSGSSH